MTRQYKLLLYFFVSILPFSSCTQLPDYEVTEDGEAIFLVELKERVTIEDLQNISEAIKDEKETEYCTLAFNIPSAYPLYPKEPWATAFYNEPDETNDSDYAFIRIMGSRTDAGKKELLNIIPKAAEPMGVWYHNHPSMEGLVVMESGGDIVELNHYQMPHLNASTGIDYEIPNETIPPDKYLHPDLTDYLKANKDFTEFRSDNGTLQYIIDEKGNLIQLLADGVKRTMEAVK